MPSAPPVGGMITSKSLSYSLNPYGLIFRSYSSGVQSIQSQREGNDGELFGLSLQPLGGNLLVGTSSDNGARLQVSGSATISTSVGINTTSPSAPLHIVTPTGVNFQNAIRFEKAGGFGEVNLENYYTSGSNYGFGIDVAGTTMMVVNNLGNVGIGTTSPAAKLDIAGGDLYVRTGGIIYANTLSPYSGNMTISLGGSGNNLIVSGGNVGIGTASPSQALDVYRDSSVASYVVARNGSGVQTAMGVAGDNGSLLGTLSNHNLRIVTNGAVVATITNSGNVLIGTTSPGVRLVNSGATLASVPTLGAGHIGADAILSANGFYGLYTGVSSEGWVWQQVQRNDANTAVYPLVLQPSGGNVLIGTTTDVGARLHVNGDVRTAAPTGGSAVNWRLGTVRGGTVTPNATVRVEIGGVLVDLDARYV